jgi:hypothetical protein
MTAQIIPFHSPSGCRRLTAVEIGILFGMAIGLMAFWTVLLWWVL